MVALVAALGVVGASAVTAVGVGFGMLWRRISDLESRVAKLSEREARIRWWAFDVKDLYYRNRREGAPDLPPIPNPEEDS